MDTIEGMRFYKSRPPEEQGPELDARTAFVKNLPSNLTENQLKDIFKEF